MKATDPIADMLIRLKNASLIQKENVEVPASKVKLELAKILKSEGFIQDYKLIDDKRQGVIIITMKYSPDGSCALSGVKRISKVGRRIYIKSADIPKVRGGLGIAILSTSKGLLTDRQARQLHIGGEILCYVW